MDEYEGPSEEYQRLGIEQLRLPTIDHSDVSVDDMIKAIKFIARHRSMGHGVYIHCKVW